VGDAFDHICVNYCKSAGVRWTLYEEINEEGQDIADEYPDEYIMANIRFLKGNQSEERFRDAECIKATFGMAAPQNHRSLVLSSYIHAAACFL
jgi:hypothetical protein